MRRCEQVQQEHVFVSYYGAPTSPLQMRLRPLYTNPGEGMDDAAIVGGSNASGGNGGGDPGVMAAAAGTELDHSRCMDLLQLALYAQEGGFDGGFTWSRSDLSERVRERRLRTRSPHSLLPYTQLTPPPLRTSQLQLCPVHCLLGAPLPTTHCRRHPI